MSGDLLGVFEPSVVLQVNRDAGFAPGGRASGAGPRRRQSHDEYLQQGGIENEQTTTTNDQ